MKICTFNIQNKYKKNIEDYKILEKYIIKNKIDILGIQELTKVGNRYLKNIFNIFGRGRLLFPFIYLKYNEYNSIITKFNVIKTKTYFLPFLGSKIPRIATECIINNNGKLIRVINTHLCLEKYHRVKKRQLNKLYKIISKSDIPTIIMGDFNSKESNYEFKEFVLKLEKLGISKIKNNKNTFNKKIIDYIFISDSFKVKNIKVDESINISDHYPLIIDIF